MSGKGVNDADDFITLVEMIEDIGADEGAVMVGGEIVDRGLRAGERVGFVPEAGDADAELVHG